MCFKNTKESYGVIAKSFHWLMAVFIIILLAVGLIMADMENTPDKFKLIGLHKSFGILVLLLAILRLGWKVLDVSPSLPDGMEKFVKLAAKVGHVLLYILMFTMPISGWLMSSAAGFPVSVFGLFVMPDLIGKDKEFAHYLHEIHELLAWALIGLIVVHVLAALFHHFYYKDDILRRMLPRFGGKK
ncbi:MAG: cytochrome b [Rickettsiales bacterium]